MWCSCLGWLLLLQGKGRTLGSELWKWEVALRFNHEKGSGAASLTSEVPWARPGDFSVSVLNVSICAWPSVCSTWPCCVCCGRRSEFPLLPVEAPWDTAVTIPKTGRCCGVPVLWTWMCHELKWVLFPSALHLWVYGQPHFPSLWPLGGSSAAACHRYFYKWAHCSSAFGLSLMSQALAQTCEKICAITPFPAEKPLKIHYLVLFWLRNLILYDTNS